MLIGESDMGRVIDFIQQAPDGFFLYLAHAYSRHDTRHNYYNLKSVFFSFIFLDSDKCCLFPLRVVNYDPYIREYFTISNSGVSYYRPGEEVEFTPLESFAKEYYRFTRLVQVKYFTLFSSYKCRNLVALDQSIRHFPVRFFCIDVVHTLT